MNTLVLNLENLAATEYTTPFTGLAGNYEATATGVYAAGGTEDDGVAFASGISFGMKLTGSARKQHPRYLYIYHTGEPVLTATITDSGGVSHSYDEAHRTDRAGRFTLGRGFRDNYLAVGLTSDGSDAFAIDKIEFDADVSANRRI